MPSLLWAIRIKYLSAKDDKWHRHTTKWHCHSNFAWFEVDKYLFDNRYRIIESSCSLIHKETK